MTGQQSLEALERANRVRRSMVVVKDRLAHEGRVARRAGRSRKGASLGLLARMLRTDPLDVGLGAMTVEQALSACYRVGVRQVPGLLADAGAGSEGRRVRELTRRQREALAVRLEDGRWGS